MRRLSFPIAIALVIGAAVLSLSLPARPLPLPPAESGSPVAASATLATVGRAPDAPNVDGPDAGNPRFVVLAYPRG